MAKPLRVLFVDDDEGDVLMLVRELKKAGFDTRWKRVDSEAGLRAAAPAEG